MSDRIRDGISQKIRLKAALQPDSVSVDERSLADMLQFLYEYSAELRYFDENDEADDTWQKFFPRSQKINSDVVPQELLNAILGKLSDQILNKRLDEIPYDVLKEVSKKIRDKVWDKPVQETIAFLKAPDSLPEDKARQYQQPHFVLLLTFLQLLERTKQHLNGFTKRHLDFYFLEFLRMQKKKAVPDHVNVLIDLAKQRESFLLPAGTLLHAGKDSAGKLITYKTDKDTQLNHARIAELRAVYVDKKNLSLQEIYEDKANKDDNIKAILKILTVVLGSVDPLTCEDITKLYKQGGAEANFHLSNKDFKFIHRIAKKEWIEEYELNLLYTILSLARKKKISKELAKVLVLKEKDSAFIARRKRELQKDIVLEKEEWQGLYAIEDVKKVTVSNDVNAKNTAQRWKTFGQFSSEKGGRYPADFGLAISSPVLLLTQGYRTINVTFDFSVELPLLKEDRLENYAHLFQVSLSTEKGWIEADNEKYVPDPDPEKPGDKVKELEINLEEKKKKLEIKIAFLATKESIMASSPDTAPHSAWPVLKILYRSSKGTDSLYKALTGTPLKNITLYVGVSGLSNLKLWNDVQELDSAKPFQPFGPGPFVGSRFHIAHPELTAKKLSVSEDETSKIKFNIKWANIDILTNGYYRNYKKITEAKTKEAEAEAEKEKTDKDLFKIKFGKNNELPAGEKEKLLQDSITLKVPPEVLDRPESIYWELENPDFQHSVYPKLAAEKATQLAIALVKPPESFTSDSYIVNPPFTPVIKELTLDYSASTDLNSKTNEIEVFHLHPFGYTAEEQTIEDTADEKKDITFLPQYNNAGELYIGLEGLKPPQHLSMLFQMAEGSADADMPPSPVYWDYLDGNEWHPLENGGVLQDGTRGLINSGNITFALPAPDAKKPPNTLLPPELYWLRASVRKRPDSVCDTVAIHTQAVSATLVDNDNAPDHFRQPLAKESIKKLLHPLPAIKAVHQPYTSFGGKTAEEDKWFYTRVSERLRHKQRALTVWDYEHLVLERFPQIYKVKCIPANESKPGTVEIVVIPDIRNRLPADPFEPKAPVNLLEDIQGYLEEMAPDSANIVVKNANYVPFLVRMGVRFRQGYEEGYHIDRLQDELNQFLAPWAYAEGEDIVFGGKIYASSIINFVERLDYVDYLAQLNFFPTGLREGENSISAKDGADVLVPERKHFIDAIPEGGYQFGINYMRIELDFQVANS